MNIKYIDSLLSSLKGDYIAEAKGHKPSKRWLQDFNEEIREIKSYRGREILELLQNADDAQSDSVIISLDTDRQILRINNSGPRTLPFTEAGVESIMFANLSPKRGSNLIGAKGLGFRSILNWATSIEIISGNADIKFESDIVAKFWRTRMRPNLIGFEEYEQQAINNNREVPIAILTMPEINEVKAVDSTSISLNYHKDREASIIHDLKEFKPKSLLFLHNIKSIYIIINGEEYAQYDNRIKIDNGNIAVSTLMGEDWVIAKEYGTVRVGNNDNNYEIACAFCLSDNRQNDEPIYNFFPTLVNSGLPCILHATLELDSSRNSLLSGSANNSAVIKKLPAVIKEVADYIKTQKNSWDAYTLMRPAITLKKSDYISELYMLLNKTNGEYIPTISGKYVKPDECYYYTDQLFEIIRQSKYGKEYFPYMRLNVPHNSSIIITANYLPNNESIEQFVHKLVNDYETLAKFIVELSKFATSKNLSLNYHVFIDANNNIIKGRTYINGGDKIESIPSFLQFNYIHTQLELALKGNMILKSGHPEQERDMASKLNCVGDISSSDITYIIRNILPKKQDSLRPIMEQKELLSCLFNIYITRRKDFSIGDIKVYLPTEEGNEWARTDTLVMADKRFPNGLDNLNLGFKYDKSKCVLFPDFLLTEGVTENDIQDFLISLGVSLYFCRKRIPFTMEYLLTLNLTSDVLNNCTWKDRDQKNYADVADMSFLSDLGLNNLITLLTTDESDYFNEVCGGQLIHWFMKSYKTPVKVSVSFAAYLLRTQTQAKYLKYYAVEDDEWLPGMKPKNILPFSSDYRTKQLLEALGARKHLSDFTSKELYDAIKRQADNHIPPTGIQSFYHKIKQALDSKGDIEIPTSLPMFCTLDRNIEIRESREIFYSDNNCLPEELVKKLPVLLMNRREGELLVKKCFGCKSFKDVSTQFKENPKENTIVADELRIKMMELSPYFLAFVSENIGTKGGNSPVNMVARKALSELNIRIITYGKYRCAVSSKSLGEYEIKDGELIYVDNIPVICTRENKLSEALEAPKFCNAIVEAVCIALRLTVKDNNDRFYRLIRSNQSELDYIQNYEINTELWQSCQAAFDMSDKELCFWKKVFRANGKDSDFDEDRIKAEKSCYIADRLGISTDRANASNFKLFHLQQLQKERNGYVAYFKIWLHEKSEANRDMQRHYLRNINDFQSDSWIEDALSKWNGRYEIAPDYHDFINQQILEIFNFNLDGFEAVDSAVPVKKENYNYDGLELNIEDESLLYFDGNEEYFEQLKNRYICDEAVEKEESSTINNSDKEETTPLKISIIVAEKKVNRATDKNSRNIRGRGKTRRKASDSYLKKIGNEAEDKVLEALKSPDSEYEVGQIYSSHLNPDSGNDAQGYDLEYKRKGDKIFRCLEIKNFVGGSIIVSRHEYETAQSETYRNRYDVALVTGDEIQIWENAFSDESRYVVLPDSKTSW